MRSAPNIFPNIKLIQANQLTSILSKITQKAIGLGVRIQRHLGVRIRRIFI